MKMIKKSAALILALALALSLNACGKKPATTTTAPTTTTEPKTTAAPIPEKEYAPTSNGIFIMRDGSVKSAEVSDFDNSGFDQERYTEATLWDFVEDTLEEYNKSKGKTAAVTVDSLTVKDKKATLVLNYDCIDTFLDFMGHDYNVKALEINSLKKLMNENKDLGDMYDVDGNAVSLDYLYEYEDCTVVTVTGKVYVTVSGELRCISEGVTRVSENVVRINSETGATLIFR